MAQDGRSIQRGANHGTRGRYARCPSVAAPRWESCAAQEPHKHSRRPASVDDYVLGEEDEIEISVYGNDDLVKTQAVRPGGYITFPLIGSIRASGLTPEQLREQIAVQLEPFVRNPQVAVIVRAYNSRKVSVLGEVKTPGLQRMSSDITVLEALSRAGGVNEGADLRGALLLRGQKLVPVDFTRLLKTGTPVRTSPSSPAMSFSCRASTKRKCSCLARSALRRSFR